MKYTWLLLLLLFSFSNTSNAQKIHHYLVFDENGKKGLINHDGEVVIAPQYDAFKATYTERRPFIIASKDRKLGVMDTSGQVILPFQFIDVNITSVNPYGFKVRDENGVFPTDSTGQPLINKKYDDIVWINKQFIGGKKGDAWGVHELGGEQILPCKYYGFNKVKRLIGWYTDEYFVFFGNVAGTQKGLMNKAGDLVLPPKFRDIQIVNDELAVANYKELMKFYTINDGDSLDVIFRYAKKLTNNHLSLHTGYTPNRLARIFNISEKKIIETEKVYSDIRALNKQYFKAYTGAWQVIDSSGNLVLEDFYEDVKWFTGDLFKTELFGNWGISGLNQSIPLAHRYDIIHSLNSDGFAIVEKNQKKGLINSKGKLVIPAEFDRIVKENGEYRAYLGLSLTVFNASPDGTLTQKGDTRKVRTIRAGYRDNPSKARTTGLAFNGTAVTQTMTARNDLTITKNNRRFGFEQDSDGQEVLEPKFFSIYRVPSSNLSIITEERKEFTLFYHWSKIEGWKKNPKIYHETGRRFIHQDEIVGLRAKDFESGKYAAYIRKDGSFGLIDRNGVIPKDDKGQPLRFTYILPFSEGYARVYKKGKLVIPEFGIVSHPNIIGDSKKLCSEFHIAHDFDVTNTYPLMAEGYAWTYLDSNLQEITDPIFISARDFKSGSAICQLKSGFGIINPQLDTLLSFKHLSIEVFGDYKSDSLFKITIGNPNPLHFNEKGEELYKARQYERSLPFENGLARVKKGDLWGFVNEKFELVVPCKYQLVRSFSEGWAAVRMNNQWHFIDTTSTIQMSLNVNIRDIGTFKNGMCWFKVGNKYGFISKEKPIAVPPRFNSVTDFEADVAVVETKNGFGIITPDGQFVLKPSLKVIKAFNEYGVAAYKKADSRFWGLMDNSGNLLTEPKYEVIGKYHNGYAKVRKNYSYGLIDSLGQLVIPIDYEQVGEYYEDLIAVKIRYKNWQYVDINNKVQITGAFSNAKRFIDGKAIVTKRNDREDEEYIIDKTGQLTRNQLAKNVVFYTEGISGIKVNSYYRNGSIKDTKYHFKDTLDRKIGANYKEIEPFIDGYAIVKTLTNEYGVLDKNGFYAIEPKYRKIFRLDNGHFKAIANRHHGLIYRDGTPFLPPIYDKLSLIGISKNLPSGRVKRDNYLKIEAGDRIEYLDRNGEWVWRE